KSYKLERTDKLAQPDYPLSSVEITDDESVARVCALSRRRRRQRRTRAIDALAPRSPPAARMTLGSRPRPGRRRSFRPCSSAFPAPCADGSPAETTAARQDRRRRSETCRPSPDPWARSRSMPWLPCSISIILVIIVFKFRRLEKRRLAHFLHR